MLGKGFTVTALIALGANLPLSTAADEKLPEETLRAALRALSAGGLMVQSVSPFYRTPCFPPGAGPDYVNAAARLGTDLSPGAVLDQLHAIEADFGRERGQRWGMRTLDLDLIAVDDQVLPDRKTWAQWANLTATDQARRTPDRLILPHPRLADRGFVLVPLADFAPDWVHPVTGLTVQQMRDALPPADLAAVVPLSDQ